MLGNPLKVFSNDSVANLPYFKGGRFSGFSRDGNTTYEGFLGKKEVATATAFTVEHSLSHVSIVASDDTGNSCFACPLRWLLP
jgi:hypothetical protein